MALSLLYVEDDPNDAFFLERAIVDAKLDVRAATVPDGDIAVDWLLGKGIYAARDKFPQPDVLVLDLKLPRLNGFGVLNSIRGLQSLKGLTVVIYSSSLQTRDVTTTLANGASRFIGKTSDCAELICYLRNLVSSKTHATATAVSTSAAQAMSTTMYGARASQ